MRGRATGSDAERRAARMLADQLRAGGRSAEVRTLWLRSRWHLALALGCVLAVAGSLVSVSQPEIGLGIALAALALMVLDLGGQVPGLRLLTPARATQNVVSPAPGPARVTLVVTAATDVPRGGGFRRVDAWLGGRAPLVLLAAVLAVVVTVGLQADGTEGQRIAVVQLVPTIVLLVAAALLLESSRAKALEGTNAASAPAAVLALVARLDARPPRHVAVEVVLTGAGDSGGALGLAAYIRQRRAELGQEEVALLHLEPCAAGPPCWWLGDGLLTRLRLHPQLDAGARAVAEAEGHLGALPYRGRGATGALAARRARWPAIAIGSAVTGDPAREPADPDALRASVDFAAAIVAALDRDLARADPG